MTHDARWTDLDLERYLDADLDEASQAALHESLLRHASLRRRLQAIRSRDETARRALLSAAPAPVRRPRRGALPLAAAAALVLCAGGAAVWWRPAPPPGLLPDAPVAADPARGVMPSNLVLAVRLERRPERPAPAAHETAAAPHAAMLDAALRRGDTDTAIALLLEAPALDRADAWSRLGSLLLSADTAQEALATLPPEAQLEALRAWSARPAQRVVVFTRIGEMLRDPSTVARARALRDELSADPDLRPWLASYAMLD